jgi:hypothetical protein
MSEEGWIPWSGGECPVLARTVVEVRFRMETLGTMTERSDFFDWVWPDDDPYNDDIIAYRILNTQDQSR